MNQPFYKRLTALLLAFLLGILFNVLFFSQTLGVSYPIYLMAFYLVFFYCLKDRLRLKLNLAWVLMLPIFLLALTYLFFSNEIFYVLNFLAIPFLVIIQTVLVTESNTYDWRQPTFIIDIIYGCFYRTIGCIGKPFKMIRKLFPAREEVRAPSKIGKILAGVFISVPLVIILASMLASADAVFGSLVNKVPVWFTGIEFGEFIVRSILVILVFLVSAGYIASLAERKMPEKTIQDNSIQSVPKILDPVIAATVLTIVNVLYIFFVVIQFAYLFGSFNFELPEGYTYSEYARMGFLELVVVSVINFCILLASIGLTKAAGEAQKLLDKILQIIMVGCTCVILVSAWYRMLMYEEAYGFTYLRVLTQAFMVFMLVLLAIMVVKICKTNMSLFMPYLAVTLSAFVLINYLNVDIIIARNNINRYHQTGDLDLEYIRYLSYDAVSELVQQLDELEGKTKMTAQEILKNKREYLENIRSWQSFNVSRLRAAKFIDEAAIGKD